MAAARSREFQVIVTVLNEGTRMRTYHRRLESNCNRENAPKNSDIAQRVIADHLSANKSTVSRQPCSFIGHRIKLPKRTHRQACLRQSQFLRFRISNTTWTETKKHDPREFEFSVNRRSPRRHWQSKHHPTLDQTARSYSHVPVTMRGGNFCKVHSTVDACKADFTAYLGVGL